MKKNRSQKHDNILKRTRAHLTNTSKKAENQGEQNRNKDNQRTRGLATTVDRTDPDLHHHTRGDLVMIRRNSLIRFKNAFPQQLIPNRDSYRITQTKERE
ncbi:hypothetical protein Bca4012_047762 [Brassica carinata]